MTARAGSERPTESASSALSPISRRQNNIMRQAQDLEPDDPFAEGLRQTYNDLDAGRRATLAALGELDAADQDRPPRGPARRTPVYSTRCHT